MLDFQPQMLSSELANQTLQTQAELMPELKLSFGSTTHFWGKQLKMTSVMLRRLARAWTRVRIKNLYLVLKVHFVIFLEILLDSFFRIL